MMKMGMLHAASVSSPSRVIEFCQKATVEELRAKGAVHLVQENG